MKSNQKIKELDKQLKRYFSSKKDKAFNLKLLGISPDLRELPGTPLQKKVWKELLRIPFGKTVSYLDLAKKVGNPKAVRAVANAVGANPLHIIIPCHRVLPTKPKSKGDIGGYAGGVEVKRLLLSYEGSLHPQD
jgi:methylated-DNA-[protein]-cysteine S-methyltransferase